MYAFVLVIHILACIFLIAVILLQAGRGGGLSDMMGGGQAQNILGTETNTFLTRATEAFAVVFVVTSLSLALMSTEQGKSLVDKQELNRLAAQAVPKAPEAGSPAEAPQAPAKDTALPDDAAS